MQKYLRYPQGKYFFTASISTAASVLIGTIGMSEIIKCNASSDLFFVEKYLSAVPDQIAWGSQLVVNEGQEALFVKGGLAVEVYGPGTHTLQSGSSGFAGNIFAGRSPFTGEVWFISKTAKLDLNWGTPQRISLIDPLFNYPVNIGAFGLYGIRIEDSRRFYTQLVGTQSLADSSRIRSYFAGEIVEKLTLILSRRIAAGESIFQINASISEIADAVEAEVSAEFERFGLEVVNFSIKNINLPPEEIKQIQSVMAKRMEMQQLGSVEIGQGYLTAKSMEIMQLAAGNSNGGAGAFVGAAAGMGMGMGAGFPLGMQVAREAASVADDDWERKLIKLKDMFDKNLITEEEYNSKRESIISKI